MLGRVTDSNAHVMASILVEASPDRFQTIFRSSLEQGRKAAPAEFQLRAREGCRLEAAFVALQ